MPRETCPPSMMLPMPTREANFSYHAYVGLLRNFILADGQRSHDSRAVTLFTGRNGKMKILFSHDQPPA